MRVDVVTIFPEVFPGPLSVGVMGRARDRGLLDLVVWDLRDFTEDRHRSVDDLPYGGGVGMVMKPEPFGRALDAIRAARPETEPRVLLTSPQGERLTQARARVLAECPHLVVLCGRYEGVDERVPMALGADEISIGDYVLTGGELAAMVLIEVVARLVPGAVGQRASVADDSFSAGLLDFPQFTRPAGVSRARGAGRAAERTPRGDPPVAEARGAAPHARPAPGSDRRGDARRRGADAARRAQER